MVGEYPSTTPWVDGLWVTHPRAYKRSGPSLHSPHGRGTPLFGASAAGDANLNHLLIRYGQDAADGPSRCLRWGDLFRLQLRTNSPNAR